MTDQPPLLKENHAFSKDDRRSQRRISSQSLLDGGNRLLIEHQGVDYLLQVTRQGKLILTK